MSYIVDDLKGLARPIDLFELDPDNARTGHDVAGIAESLATYGQRKPIVANGAGGPPFRITAGNGTWQAAVSLGWTHIAAVVVDEPVSEATEYALVDNALAEASRWHPERLRAALARIPAERPVGGSGRVLELLRSRQATLVSSQSSVPSHGPSIGGADSAENGNSPVSAEPGSKAQDSAENAVSFGVRFGDIWRLAGDGRDHWLICGDCRPVAVEDSPLPYGAWEPLLAAAGVSAVNGVFTSSPYAGQREGSGPDRPLDAYQSVFDWFIDWFESVAVQAKNHLTADGSFFLNIREHTAGGERDLYVHKLVIWMVERCGWHYIDDLAWIRQGFPGRYRNRFKNAWEPVYHFALTSDCVFRPGNVSEETDLSYATAYSAENNTTMGPAFDGRTGRNVKAADGRALPTNIVRAYTGAHDPTAVTGHGATFPVQLPEFFLRAYSEPGDVWLDPFAGTGTTLLAAERTGRVGLGIEIEPAICELALGRWARHMGQRPERVS